MGPVHNLTSLDLRYSLTIHSTEISVVSKAVLVAILKRACA